MIYQDNQRTTMKRIKYYQNACARDLGIQPSELSKYFNDGYKNKDKDFVASIDAAIEQFRLQLYTNQPNKKGS